MEVTEETRQWCASRNHPLVTYNPLEERTYCRCGQRQDAGDAPMDWEAKWAMFHDHAPDEPCRCYLT